MLTSKNDVEKMCLPVPELVKLIVIHTYTKYKKGSPQLGFQHHTVGVKTRSREHLKNIQTPEKERNDMIDEQT